MTQNQIKVGSHDLQGVDFFNIDVPKLSKII